MRKLLLSTALFVVLFGSAFALDDSGAENTPTSSHGSLIGVDSTGQALLTTLFAADNGFAGNSFDIIAAVPLTVVGFDANLDAVSLTVNVYTREGTANGFEGSAAGWTLIGTDAVVGAGGDIPTHVNIGGFSMIAGDTVGVIMQVSEFTGINYTNGGPNTYSNSDMTIVTFCGLGDGFPPVSIFSYRAWNGTVHYNYDTPLNQETWGSIKALL